MNPFRNTDRILRAVAPVYVQCDEGLLPRLWFFFSKFCLITYIIGLK